MATVHQKELSEVLTSLGREHEGSVPQCYYVFGDKGMGKTYFLREIESRYSNDNILIPVYRDLLLKPIINFDELATFLSARAGRVLLLLDNIDSMLAFWKEEDLSRLRAMIYQENGPVIVSTGGKIPSQLSDYKEPLYDSMSLLSLRQISENDTMSIIQDEVKSLSKRAQDDVSAVYNKIGGSPMVASLLARSIKTKYGNAENLTWIVLSTFSVYYESVIRSLSAVQHRIVTTLLENGPLTLTELRNLMDLKASDLTGALKRLEKNDILFAHRTQPKKTSYAIRDKVFRQWYNYASV